MRAALSEQTWIDYRPASFGSRALAYSLDFTLRWSVILLIFLALSFIVDLSSLAGSMIDVEDVLSPSRAGMLTMSVIVLLVFLVEWSYPIYFEVYHSGVSPGKKAFGLRVVSEKGLPITFKASLLRTVMLIVDQLPALGLVALISMFFSRKSQRLGDLVASTLVVYDSESEESAPERFSHSDTAVTMLPIDEYRMLENFLSRVGELVGDFKVRTVDQVWRVFSSRCLSKSDQEPSIERKQELLRGLYARAHPVAEGQEERSEAAALEWGQIRSELREARAKLKLLEAESDGVPAGTLREAATTYQFVCQRYAYLSTFYPDTREARAAARLVRLGRRLIYGRRLEAAAERQGLLARAAAGFTVVRYYCLVSALTLIASGLFTAALIKLNPNLGWRFLSEEVAAQLQAGRLWTESIKGIGEMAASRIMTNNISVSFAAFALGVAGGAGTLILLLFNGALLGGLFAALDRFDMSFRLFEFVVAHGFLELSIIAVAAGCGLAIGDAILNPGAMTRKQALQRRARPAIDVALFSAICLVPAGLVEGFVSPYEQIPFMVKLGLGLVLGAAYWSVLLGGVGKRP